MSGIWAKRGLCAVLLLGLAACGNTQRDAVGKRVSSTVFAIVKSKFVKPDAPPTPELMRSLAPRLVAQVDVPLLLVSQQRLNVADFFALSVDADPYRVFGSDSQISLTLEGPILSQSRGLGDDLMSSETGELPELLAQHRTGDYQRVMRYLDGVGQQISYVYDCRLTQLNETHMRENCTAPDDAFLNIYEYGPKGGVIRSEQWIGPSNQYLIVEHLN